MKSSPRILLTRASGSIGGPLAAEFERAGHDVIRLVSREPEPTDEFQWEPNSGEVDDRALKGPDGVIHLSGAGMFRNPGLTNFLGEIVR